MEALKTFLLMRQHNWVRQMKIVSQEAGLIVTLIVNVPIVEPTAAQIVHVVVLEAILGQMLNVNLFDGN